MLIIIPSTQFTVCRPVSLVNTKSCVKKSIDSQHGMIAKSYILGRGLQAGEGGGGGMFT